MDPVHRKDGRKVDEVWVVVQAPFGIISRKWPKKINVSFFVVYIECTFIDRYVYVLGKYCNFTTLVERPGNLAGHLQAKHKEAYANYLAKTWAKTVPKSSSRNSTSKSLSSLNSTLSTTSSTIRYYDEDSDHYKNLLNAVALLFASNSLPYLLIESLDFVHLVKLLDPKFKLPKRRRLTSEVGALHEKLKPTLKSEIKKAGKVCLILDIWSRRGLSESYLGILIRYFGLYLYKFFIGKTILNRFVEDGRIAYC